MEITFLYEPQCVNWWCIRWEFFKHHPKARLMHRSNINLWNKTVVQFEYKYWWIDFEGGEQHKAVLTLVDKEGDELNRATWWLLHHPKYDDLSSKINIRGEAGPSRLIKYWKEKA